MGRARKEPPLKEKLAAALREFGDIPYEHACLMTADQVISLFQFNHILYHRDGGSDEHWNLEPMFIRAHRDRTTKVDIPQIAKTKRISHAEEAFRARLLTPRDEREPKKSRWASRPFPSRRKKL